MPLNLSDSSKKLRYRKRAGILFLLTVLIVLFFYYQNNALQITRIDIASSKVNNDFSIVHLSDLHGKTFGKASHSLITKVESLNPDIIVFTGDLVDKNSSIDKSVETLERLTSIGPVYYVPGNHEYRSNKLSNLYSRLEQTSVIVLENQSHEIEHGNRTISIFGIDYLADSSKEINSRLAEFAGQDMYKIVLDHYPENFSNHISYDIDLVLSGHAHGGQFILPFLGGLYSPGQGFFPKYYRGIYTEDNTSMVVSRGLGNSVIPIRLFNRPEIVHIRLLSQ